MYFIKEYQKNNPRHEILEISSGINKILAVSLSDLYSLVARDKVFNAEIINGEIVIDQKDMMVMLNILSRLSDTNCVKLKEFDKIRLCNLVENTKDIIITKVVYNNPEFNTPNVNNFVIRGSKMEKYITQDDTQSCSNKNGTIKIPKGTVGDVYGRMYDSAEIRIDLGVKCIIQIDFLDYCKYFKRK